MGLFARSSTEKRSETMRVVSGSARGILLEAPKGMTTRPTSDKAKEGVFSAIQSDVAGARVLDIFAGSGGMGIEALSRGAASCVFVDFDSNALRCIKNNLAKTKLTGKIVRKEAIAFASGCADRFDVIFSDPPYNKGWTAKLMPLAAELLDEGGVLLCETDSAEPRPEPVEGLALRKTYIYGRAVVTLFDKISGKGADADENSGISG